MKLLIKILLFIALLVQFGSISAQSEMFLIKTDGTNRMFQLSQTEIAFTSTGDIIIRESTDVPIVFVDNIIQEIVFKLPEVNNGITSIIKDGWLIINGISFTLPQTIRIYSPIGLLVKSVILSENEPIDLRSLQAGIYLVKVGDEKKTKSIKVIKKDNF